MQYLCIFFLLNMPLLQIRGEGIFNNSFKKTYDHNALDFEYLSNTHEPFFKQIRKAI